MFIRMTKLEMVQSTMDSEIDHSAKILAWDYFKAQCCGELEGIKTTLNTYFNDETKCFLSHPINTQIGTDALLENHWHPLLNAFPDLERRDDVFLTGEFNGKFWAVATGYFVGTFVKDWLGIRATQAATFIRFGEIIHLEDRKIKESYVILDIVDVARQAGTRLIPQSLGAEHIAPGPETHDGILLSPQDDVESAKSLALVEGMMHGLHDFDGNNVTSTHQENFWDPNMMWYGPSGIGTTRGLKGFQNYHQIPFLKFIPDRVGGHHYARIASGHYIASGGWPSVKATTSGAPWISTSIPAGQKIGMRVMDFWRREDNALKENWVLIDIPDALYQCGVDVFANLHQ